MWTELHASVVLFEMVKDADIYRLVTPVALITSSCWRFLFGVHRLHATGSGVPSAPVKALLCASCRHRLQSPCSKKVS